MLISFPSQIGISKPGNHLALRVLAYYLIFFPSLDVMSAYPLVVHVLVNNIYIIITGRDTSVPGKWRLDWLLRLVLRLAGSIAPLLAAMGMANLIQVINYGGLTGYIVCYFFPAVLQLTSIRKCKKTFSGEFSSGGRIQKEGGTTFVPPSVRTSDYVSSENESVPLIPNRKSHDRSYMTPYSIPFLSHPWFVWFMMGIIVAIFVLIVASISVKPTPMTCEETY